MYNMEYVQFELCMNKIWKNNPTFNRICNKYFPSLLYTIMESDFLENILIMSIHENAVTNKVQTDALCMGVVLFKFVISRF